MLAKLPKVFSGSGLTGLADLSRRVKEWTDQVQALLTGLREEVTDLRENPVSSGGGGAVESVFGRDGAVVAVAGDYAASEVDNDSSVAGATVKDALETLDAAIPAAYTDEMAQDAVGGIVLPSDGPVRLIYSDGTPSLTVEVDDMVGDSGSGGTEGLVPAPDAGDGAAQKALLADGTWGFPPAFSASYFRGYFAQTGNLTWSDTTWADVHGVLGGTVGSFTDDYSVGISRSNSTFTFTDAGVYWACIIVKFAVSNGHFGLRLRQGGSTVLQQGAYDSATVRTMVLSGPLVVSASATVTVQYCRTGSNATITTAQLNGEDQHALNWSFIRIS